MSVELVIAAFKRRHVGSCTGLIANNIMWIDFVASHARFLPLVHVLVWSRR